MRCGVLDRRFRGDDRSASCAAVRLNLHPTREILAHAARAARHILVTRSTRLPVLPMSHARRLA